VIGRIETDIQATGPQAVSIEDTTASIHGSRGVRTPASPHLISEIRLVAEMAMATLDPNPKVPWATWADDYRVIRQEIAKTYPETFHDYDRRMWEPGGLPRPRPASHRDWKTTSGKAQIITPRGLAEDPDMPEPSHDSLRLITLRSNDQFNTTVYGYDDRFRGIKGTRMVLLMNQDDIRRLGLTEGDTVTAITDSTDGFRRALDGLRVTPYAIPVGCVGAYYPEANVLLPLSHYAEGSKTPAAKSIPVRLHAKAVA
jgi:anaerobic selenocysteine-containing dehydrogenase